MDSFLFPPTFPPSPLLTSSPSPPSARPVIIESTYGVSRHLPREERERQFLQRIHNTVRRGGRVLLPVVALGRSQVGMCENVGEMCVAEGGGGAECFRP